MAARRRGANNVMVIKEGYVTLRRGGINDKKTSDRRRWVKLFRTHLAYYESAKHRTPLRKLNLDDIAAEDGSKESRIQSCLVLYTPHEPLLFQAPSKEALRSWLEAIQTVQADGIPYLAALPTRRGPLLKLGGTHQKPEWQVLYFVLRGRHLFYYRGPAEFGHRGVIDMLDVTIEDLESEDDSWPDACFQITQGDGPPIILGADEESEAEEWMQILGMAALAAKKTNDLRVPPQPALPPLPALEDSVPDPSRGLSRGLVVMDANDEDDESYDEDEPAPAPLAYPQPAAAPMQTRVLSSSSGSSPRLANPGSPGRPRPPNYPPPDLAQLMAAPGAVPRAGESAMTSPRSGVIMPMLDSAQRTPAPSAINPAGSLPDSPLIDPYRRGGESAMGVTTGETQPMPSPSFSAASEPGITLPGYGQMAGMVASAAVLMSAGNVLWLEGAQELHIGIGWTGPSNGPPLRTMALLVDKDRKLLDAVRDHGTQSRTGLGAVAKLPQLLLSEYDSQYAILLHRLPYPIEVLFVVVDPTMPSTPEAALCRLSNLYLDMSTVISGAMPAPSRRLSTFRIGGAEIAGVAEQRGPPPVQDKHANGAPQLGAIESTRAVSIGRVWREGPETPWRFEALNRTSASQNVVDLLFEIRALHDSGKGKGCVIS